MKTITYGTFEPVKNVVVIGSGPSLAANFDGIRAYIQEKHPVVLACSYKYPIDADYTVYIDPGQFRRFYRTVTTQKIIVAPPVYPTTEQKAAKQFYQLWLNHEVQPYDVKRFIVHPDGRVGHKLANCGFASLFLSHFFCPHEVLIAGMDGPTPKGKVKRWNNRNTKYVQKDINRMEPKKRLLRDWLLPFVHSKGIVVKVFPNDPFWGCQKHVSVLGA